ncbi:protein kinase domain-containing protein [Magnetococcales bacterium HHB-1]
MANERATLMQSKKPLYRAGLSASRGPLPEGYTLQGYRIGSLLKAGQSGFTYRGIDMEHNRQVVIKEFFPTRWLQRGQDGLPLPPDDALAERWMVRRERFLAQGKILARLDHPGIMPLDDVIDVEQAAFIVSRYCDGQSLASILDQDTFVEDKQLRAWSYALADILHDLHEQNILHRDIKPNNICVRHEDQSLVLLDFGAAIHLTGKRLATVAPMLTSGYAPMEQYGDRESRLGPWSDLYALGALLYRAMTGITPPSSAQRYQAIKKGLDDPLRAVPEVMKGRYSLGLIDAVEAALALYPHDRPQKVSEWLQRFESSVAAKLRDPVHHRSVTKETMTVPSSPCETPVSLADEVTEECTSVHVFEPVKEQIKEKKPLKPRLKIRLMSRKNRRKLKKTLPESSIIDHLVQESKPIVVHTMVKAQDEEAPLLQHAAQFEGVGPDDETLEEFPIDVIDAEQILAHAKEEAMEAEGSGSFWKQFLFRPVGLKPSLLTLSALFGLGMVFLQPPEVMGAWLRTESVHETPLSVTQKSTVVVKSPQEQAAERLALNEALAGIRPVDPQPIGQLRQAETLLQNAMTVLSKEKKTRPLTDAVVVSLRKSAEMGLGAGAYHYGTFIEKGIIEGPKAEHARIKEVVYWLEKAAQQGHAAAQYRLGLAYDVGVGRAKDDKKAFLWYARAAQQDVVLAMYNLGLFWEQGRGLSTTDRKKAMFWFEKAAEAGFVDAQSALGLRMVQGKGGLLDEGVEWLRRAAKRGHVEAQLNLAIVLESGQGIKPNAKEALKWYRAAADKGVARAQRILGDMFFFGEGMGQDFTAAHRWYLRAASGKDAEAQRRLGLMYRDGLGVGKDARQAEMWFLSAARAKNPEAQYNLGVFYQREGSKKKEWPLAVEWLEKAAKQNHGGAQCALARLFEEGRGIRKDTTTAVDWYRRAAANGDREAQHRLGILLEAKANRKANRVQAFAWYSLAAAQEHPESLQRLRKLQTRMTTKGLAQGRKLARRLAVRVRSGWSTEG